MILFELIDLVSLNVTNKLDRVEDAGSIRNITVMNQQVAEATKQQSDVSEDINRNITAIQHIAENVAES